jgi:toxin YoeB
MRLVFTANGWADYTHWQTADRAMLRRINRLIDESLRDPTAGIGNLAAAAPLAGAWSRRINDEHRLVYLVDGEDLVILTARFHYE